MNQSFKGLRAVDKELLHDRLAPRLGNALFCKYPIILDQETRALAARLHVTRVGFYMGKVREDGVEHLRENLNWLRRIAYLLEIGSGVPYVVSGDLFTHERVLEIEDVRANVEDAFFEIFSRYITLCEILDPIVVPRGWQTWGTAVPRIIAHAKSAGREVREISPGRMWRVHRNSLLVR